MLLVAVGMITVGKNAVLPNPLKSRLMATKSTRMLHPLRWATMVSVCTGPVRTNGLSVCRCYLSVPSTPAHCGMAAGHGRVPRDWDAYSAGVWLLRPPINR